MALLETGAINTGEYNRQVIEGQPLPPGTYSGVVVKAAQKKTKDEAGLYVEVEIDITSPSEFSNRKFWDRFNVINKSPEAARIGKEALSDLAKAAGLATISDDQELVGREVLMELQTEPGKPYTDSYGKQHEGKPQNRCRKYWPVGTDVSSAKKEYKAQAATQPKTGWGAQKAAALAPAPTQAAPAPDTKTAPWKRNAQ